MKNYGSQSMVEPLKRVLVRRPDAAFGNADPDHWHYVSQPDLEVARPSTTPSPPPFARPVARCSTTRLLSPITPTPSSPTTR